MYCHLNYFSVVSGLLSYSLIASFRSRGLHLSHWPRDCSAFTVINMRRLFLITITAFGLAVPVSGADAQTGAKKRSPKVDQALEEALRTGVATHDVIITVKRGHRTEIRRHLEDHGDVVQSEHPSNDALVVKRHSADVAELVLRNEVATIALDAAIYANGAGKAKPNTKGTGRGKATAP